MLPFQTRLRGLTSTLSVKLAQDDLHVVKDLEIPTEDSQYIKDLIERRNWGPSVLIVDEYDKYILLFRWIFNNIFFSALTSCLEILA
jgi:large subunit ribosomal protein L4